MKKNILSALRILAVAGGTWLGEAKASQFIFDNTGLPLGDNVYAGGISGIVRDRYAQSFTTGPLGYKLDSIDIEAVGNDYIPNETVSLWSNSGQQHPNASLLSLSAGPSVYPDGVVSLVNFKHSGGFSLAPNTKYWVVIEGPLLLVSVSNPGGHNANLDEIGFGGGFSSPGGWLDLNFGIASRVAATPIPEPASVASVVGLGCAGLFLLKRGRRA